VNLSDLRKKKLVIFMHTAIPAGLTVVLFVFINYFVAIPFLHDNLMDARKKLAREITNSAWSLLDSCHRKALRGEISFHEAKRFAVRQVGDIRYGPEGKDYLWINDMHPNMVMHPYRTDLNGKDISNFKDPHGKRLFVEMVETVKKYDEGYVSYMWQWKDRSDLIVPKLSFVKAFKPWGWIVGTGLYIEDVNISIGRITRKLNYIFLVILFIIIIISFYIIRQGVRNELKRSEAEEDLRDSQRTLKGIIQFLPDAALVLNNNGEVIAWNRVMEDLTGVPAGDILGKGDLEYALPFYGRKREILANLMLSSREAIPESYDVVERDEHRIVAETFTPELAGGGQYLQATAGLLFNERGETTGVIELIRNITQRKNAEMELERAQRYIKNIINSMPSALISTDEEGRITQINNAGEELLGFPAGEGPGKIIYDTLPYLAGSNSILKEAIAQKQIFEDRKVPWKIGNKLHHFSVIVYPLISDTFRGVVIRIEDITERVELEEMMIQTEKMLSVGGLAAGMAHEINNPLAGIMGNIEVAKNRLTKDNSSNRQALEESGLTMEALSKYIEKRKIVKMLDLAHEGGERAAEIVRNMLNFAHKGEREVEAVSITDLVDRTIKLASADYDLKKKYDFKHFLLKRDYTENLPLLRVEASKVQQVILNLIVNGAEAMSESPRDDERPTFWFIVKQEDDMIRIEIKDNGPGMPEDVRRRIFEPFFTTKGIGKGTGLGLSISYFIITEDHHGSMAVESAPGEGTSFIIRLPVE